MQNKIKAELMRLAETLHLDYFGVASTDRFSNMPEDHRPEDLLPGAKSVIVLGLKVPDSAVLAHKRVFGGGQRHHYFSYTRYGYKQINENLETAAFRVANHIEKNYAYIALPLPASEPRDEELFMGAMSNRYAAVCAGLGYFGWSGFVITPKHGPRVRWVSIITDAEPEPDPLFTGKKRCDPSTCGVCVDICPVGALSREESVRVKINDEVSAYSKRSKPLCRCAIYGLVKGTPGRLQAEVPEKMETMNDWYELNKKNDPWQRMEFNHGNYCHRCMIMCPVGETGVEAEE
jgi:epoxyqueuosine reductase QueG